MVAAVDPAVSIRRLVRTVPRVALGTLLPAHGDGTPAPYVSLAMMAVDYDASPILLLSDLADHTRNIKADPRVSLLFDGTLNAAVPLAAERATLQGRAEPMGRDERLARRYVGRHADAEMYLQLADFQLYRVHVERAHLVAGFGRIHWVDGREVRFDASGAEALARAEADIVAHMNDEYVDAVQLCATQLLERRGDGWKLTGVDPEGCDFKRVNETARLWFDQPVSDPESARVELVRLVRRARERVGAAADGANPAAAHPG